MCDAKSGNTFGSDHTHGSVTQCAEEQDTICREWNTACRGAGQANITKAENLISDGVGRTRVWKAEALNLVLESTALDGSWDFERNKNISSGAKEKNRKREISVSGSGSVNGLSLVNGIARVARLQRRGHTQHMANEVQS